MSQTIADHTPIRLENLRAGYDSKTVLHDLDLVVESGERIVLLGPNGAGKTTLFRCLLGLVRPVQGQARLFGRDPSDARIRRQLLVNVGTSLESPGLPAHCRPLEYLEHFARLASLPRPRESARTALHLWELPENVDAQHLSMGQRQRLQVARSLLHSPRLAMLDEPAANLDPSAQEAFWHLLDRWQSATGSTLVVSTHHLEEAYRHGPRWILLGNGRILADGSPRNILSAVTGSRRLRLGAPVDGTQLEGILARLGIGVELVGNRQRVDSEWRLRSPNNQRDQALILKTMIGADLPVVSYGEDGASLEESYRILLGAPSTVEPTTTHEFEPPAIQAMAPGAFVAGFAAARLHVAALLRERRILFPLAFLVALLAGSAMWALPSELPSREFYLPLLALAALLPAGLAGGIASDLIAGERERRSLETFLCAPASPASLIAGRASAIALPAMGLSLVSISLVRGALQSRGLAPSWPASFAIAFGFAPAAILLSLAVGIWVSTRSRTVRAAAQMSALVSVPLVALSQAVPALTPAGFPAGEAWLCAGAILLVSTLAICARLARTLRPEFLVR